MPAVLVLDVCIFLFYALKSPCVLTIVFEGMYCNKVSVGLMVSTDNNGDCCQTVRTEVPPEMHNNFISHAALVVIITILCCCCCCWCNIYDLGK